MGDEGLRRLRVALLLSLLLIGVLTGCTQIQIETRPFDVLNTAAQAVPERPAEHDLAILAIEFDPALDTITSIQDLNGVHLLVAVENSGLVVERDVAVVVELRLDNKDPSPALVRISKIDQIAPGEVKIIRLRGLSEIPFRPEYWLKVRVSPVVGEDDTADNQRFYRLQVGPLTR
jgi:hypothetical protein